MSGQAARVAEGVASVPRRALGRAIVRLHVRVARGRLDAMLAEGADPWSSAPLLTRAAQIAGPRHRQRVATSLDALLEIAEYRRQPSPGLAVRIPEVRSERETIAALAQRLREPVPVDVGVVARLGRLTWDETSPVFARGRPVETLAETLELCASTLVD